MIYALTRAMSTVYRFRKRIDLPGNYQDVIIDYGVTVWKDGEIDIAPEYLYEHGIPA